MWASTTTPLAIRSYGVVSPVGITVQSWNAHWSQRGASTELPPPTIEKKVIEDFDVTPYLGKKGNRNFDRLTQLLLVGAEQAMVGSGVQTHGTNPAQGAVAFQWTHPWTPEQVGVSISTSYGSQDVIAGASRTCEENPRHLNPARFPNTIITTPAGYVSIRHALRGPNTTVVSGNPGALDAVLNARTHIAQGRARAFLVGGAEVLGEALEGAAQATGILRTSTPGEGLTLGEGIALFFVDADTGNHANNRPPLAWITGYGTALGPALTHSPNPLVFASADTVLRAARAALCEAGITPDQLDLVCTSKSGLNYIDQAEDQALDQLLGVCPTTRISPKDHLGETFGASGALAMATALAHLSASPPRGCNALILSTGFYGNTSAIVMQTRSA